MNKDTVKKIMQASPITVSCQTTLTKIIEALITSQLSQLPVINDGNHLIGMVSLIDCQKALLNSTYHCDYPVTVNEIMMKNFTYFSPDEHLSEVAIKTQSQNEHIFPVLQNDKLVGIMKRVDLLKELNNNLSLCSQNK